jgi:ADP-ribose pyrophosphatase
MTERTVFAGKIFSILWDECAGPNGKNLVFETVAAPDVVRVYPIYHDQLILIREYRHEVGRDVLRTVSGRIESDETPIEAARRELIEEVGFIANKFRIFAVSHPILKVRSQVNHVLAKVEEFGPAHPEEGEFVTPAPFNIRDLESIAWSGEVLEDIIALQLLRLARMLPASLAEFLT